MITVLVHFKFTCISWVAYHLNGFVVLIYLHLIFGYTCVQFEGYKYLGFFFMFILFLIWCRENEQLSKYGDTKSARSIMLVELKKLIEANPLFREKLVLPTLKASRLRTLINQRYFVFFVFVMPLFFVCKFTFWYFLWR